MQLSCFCQVTWDFPAGLPDYRAKNWQGNDSIRNYREYGDCFCYLICNMINKNNPYFGCYNWISSISLLLLYVVYVLLLCMYDAIVLVVFKGLEILLCLFISFFWPVGINTEKYFEIQQSSQLTSKLEL